MEWKLKKFEELTNYELFKIFKERTKVFVVEQNCPYQEVDDKDLKSLHLFKMNENKIQAYCRIIPHNEKIHIGRVLVLKEARGTGLGYELIKITLKYISEIFPNFDVYIQAQTYLKEFYFSFGFKAISEVYLEDNIPHIDMILKNIKN